MSAPILMIGVAMLFFARPGVGPIYLAAWLAVVYAAYSVATLAQLALAAGLSSEYNERSRVYAWWQSANTLGAVVVLLFPAMVLRFAGGKGDTVALMGWLIVMVTPITFLLALWKVREAGSTGRPARAGPLEYFKLLRRPSIRIILTIDLLLGIGAGISGASMIFFMTLNKGLDRSAIGGLLICYLLAATVSTGLWTWLGGRIQKHRALAVSALMHAIGVAPVFFAPRGNLAILYLAMAFTGAPYGGNTILPRSMIADAGDEERLAFGVDRTGMLYAWITSVFKIGSALAIGSTFLILEWAGFKASAGMGNPAAALDMVAFLYCGVPIGMAIIAAGLATRYPLTAARHAGIRAALAQRDLDEAAARARENPGDHPAATSPPG